MGDLNKGEPLDTQNEVASNKDALRDRENEGVESTKTSLAVYLSLAEIVVGSFVHGLKIPFGGHLLSLNQGFFLCRSLQLSRGRVAGAKSAMEISGVSALLKSLSPVGQKIGPMMAISAQGALFSGGVLVGGASLFGQCLGMSLLSVWAFFQPFIGLLVLYGQDLIKALLYFKERLQKDYFLTDEILLWGVLGFVALKALLGISVVFIHHRMSEGRKKNLDQLILQTAQRLQNSKLSGASIDQKSMSQGRSVWVLFRKQALSPLFLLSFALIVIFFSATEKDWVQVLWKTLRPLAILFLFLFLLTRKKWLMWMRQKLSRYSMFAGWLTRTEKVAVRLQEILYGDIRQ